MAILAEVLPRRWNARAQVYSTIATMPTGMHGVRVTIIGTGWANTLVGELRVLNEAGRSVAEIGIGGTHPDGFTCKAGMLRRSRSGINPGDYTVQMLVLQTMTAGIRIEAI